MIRYNIHGLIRVTVDDSVSALLKRAVDFQLNWFRSDEDSALRQLSIRPYKDAPTVRDQSQVRFHSAYASSSVLDDPEKRLAIRRDEQGLAIFTDTSDVTINFYLHVLLLETGHSFVHAGGVVDESGASTIFSGAGGIGKTPLVNTMVKQMGRKFLGDDLIILSREGQSLSFPRSLVLKAYLAADQELSGGFRRSPRTLLARSAQAFLDFLRANLPLVGLTKSLLGKLGIKQRLLERIPTGSAEITHAVPAQKLFGSSSIATSGAIKDFVYVVRHTGDEVGRKPLDPALAASRALAVIHHEWSGTLRHLMAMGATDFLNVHDYLQTSYRVVFESLRSVRCWELRLPESFLITDLSEDLAALSEV